LNKHFEGNNAADVKTMDVGGKQYAQVIDFQTYHKNKLDYHKKQGWGYKDSRFELDYDKMRIKFTGDKYLYSGQYLPEFFGWIE